ncbi:AAA family ATPase [Hwanghaeella sp.]|uniref:AAA family ATPase n=1 Tax=Hwanghaeella sp. TaxID=2605943 RepID=UPI003CCBD15F
MKIRQIKLNRFKRFTDLTVEGLPETAKLVLLAGPNGCGKSSFFDALYTWYKFSWSERGHNWDSLYYVKQTGEPDLKWNQSVQVDFYGAQPTDRIERKKAVYVRSAYRNQPDFEVNGLNRIESALDEDRIQRVIENDATVSKNYHRLASKGLEDLYETGDENKTFAEYRQESIGELKSIMQRLFPGLVLNSLGNPLSKGSFRFNKGASSGFLYKNLSGGEKASFDLVLDLIVKKREFDNTVFCIDEPEAHMNTRLQGALLEELYNLIPGSSQLWISTHSLGMMRRARDLADQYPDTVYFYDFDGIDFDQPQTLIPVAVNRDFWGRVLNVALDDLAELIAPRQVVICEGAPNVPGSGRNADHDAKCYDKIFGDQFPDTTFVSAGDAETVRRDRLALLREIKVLSSGTNVIRVIDRDDRSPEEIADLEGEGVRVLSRRNLESYLFDDEVLTALCAGHGKPEEANALLAQKVALVTDSQARGAAADDLKPASGEIYNATKHHLHLTACGNNAKEFCRSTLAPLVREGMQVYTDLKRDIFG